jgi:outer membrane lipoprotein-sorting protein
MVRTVSCEKELGVPFGNTKGRHSGRRLRLLLGCWIASFLYVGTLGQVRGATTSAGVDLETWLSQAEQTLTKVDNYTAIFHRVERVEGELIPEEVTFLKFKKPFKVYMKWLTPSKGQETLYIQGANHDKIRAHGGGIASIITVNLEPTGTKAMKNSRHPITEAGLQNLVQIIAINVRRALKEKELVSKDHGEKTVYGRKTRELEGTLSKDRRKGYYCYRCIVDVDSETRMPIKTQIFDWDNQLIESYGYEELKLNPGLADKDFEAENPEYHF